MYTFMHLYAYMHSLICIHIYIYIYIRLLCTACSVIFLRMYWLCQSAPRCWRQGARRRAAGNHRLFIIQRGHEHTRTWNWSESGFGSRRWAPRNISRCLGRNSNTVLGCFVPSVVLYSLVCMTLSVGTTLLLDAKAPDDAPLVKTRNSDTILFGFVLSVVLSSLECMTLSVGITLLGAKAPDDAPLVKTRNSNTTMYCFVPSVVLSSVECMW